MPKDETLEMTLKRLRLFGLLARIDEIRNAPWLKQVLTIVRSDCGQASRGPSAVFDQSRERTRAPI